MVNRIPNLLPHVNQDRDAALLDAIARWLSDDTQYTRVLSYCRSPAYHRSHTVAVHMAMHPAGINRINSATLSL